MRPYLSEPAPGRGERIKAGVATRRPAGVQRWRVAAAPARRRAVLALQDTGLFSFVWTGAIWGNQETIKIL